MIVDPRPPRRRHGWALRWYRGEHRDGAWNVDDVRRWIDESAWQTRRFHLASLRRPVDAGLIYLGSHLTLLKFYPETGAEPVNATLEIMPDAGMAAVPVLPMFADDADTGPILTVSAVGTT